MKEVYKGLQQKFCVLPSFNTLNREFEIETIEKNAFPLRAILRRMIEHVQGLKSILRPSLEPDTTISSGLYEHSCLTDKQRERAFEIFKSLCSLERGMQFSLLTKDNKTQAKIIHKVTREWMSNRRAALPIIVCFSEGWKQKHPKEKRRRYFG